jgi:restriction endonuclease S subunit
MNTKSLSELTMLLPPIETQQEIVATLDRIYAPGTTGLAETLNTAMDLVLANPNGSSLGSIVEAQRLMRKSAQMVADVKAQMMADVKAQMMAIMKSVGHRGFPIGNMGDNVSFINGYAFKSEEFLDSGIPIVKIKNIKNNVLSFEKAQYSRQDTKLSKYAVKQGDIVISLTGELSGDVGMNLTGVEWYLNQRVARIDITNKELRIQYMYYYMVYSDFTESVRNLSTGSAQPNVSTKNIESLTLPLPSIEFQYAIISRLNALQTQLTSLENLGKQAEDNARFILESYLG